jgi:hypothetical protein
MKSKLELIQAILDNDYLQAYALAEATRTLGRGVSGDDDEAHYEAQTQVIEGLLNEVKLALRP